MRRTNFDRSTGWSSLAKINPLKLVWCVVPPACDHGDVLEFLSPKSCVSVPTDDSASRIVSYKNCSRYITACQPGPGGPGARYGAQSWWLESIGYRHELFWNSLSRILAILVLFRLIFFGRADFIGGL